MVKEKGHQRNYDAVWAAAVAGGTVIVALLQWLVFLPAHAHGLAQPVLGVVNETATMICQPGLLAINHFIRPYERHLLPGQWLRVVAWDVLFYFVATILARWAWRRMVWRKPRGMPAIDAAAPLPAFRERRRFLAIGAKVAGAGLLGVAGYSVGIEPRALQVTRRQFGVRGLPKTLDRLTIAQVTDVHLGPWISLAYVREAVEKTNALGVDLICLTGDYVHQDPAYIRPSIAALSRLTSRIGMLAVLGNHDHWEGRERSVAALREFQIPLIDNTRMILTPDRRIVPATHGVEDGLCIAGVGDYWEDDQDYAAALGDLPAAMPRILLSHNPDVAEDRDFVEPKWRVDLMLCGHTHGGQVRLPGMGTPVVPSRYGQKYAQGLVAGPTCPVFICRGIGMSLMPVRFGVPPEIAVIELRSA